MTSLPSVRLPISSGLDALSSEINGVSHILDRLSQMGHCLIPGPAIQSLS